MARRSRAAWAKLVREWGESGQPAQAFAGRRGVSHRSLQWWAAKLRRDEAAAGARLEFVEIRQPVVSGNGDGRFEVLLGNGRRVLVPTGFDDGSLARLLSVVEGAG